MTQLRKIGAWIWLNKERMFLAALVLVLCYRVYLVVYPPAPEADFVARAPRSLPDPPPADVVPGPPPLPPPPFIRETWRSLYVRSPFTYYAAEGAGESGDVESLNIRLLDIQILPNGNERARIRTTSADKWYTEGEKFEQFELLDVDPEGQVVEVYSEQLAKRLVLEIE